jgi:hypothetical protein
MKPQVGRRVFVGGVVAGLPLLATAGSGLFAQSAGPGRLAPGPGRDPIRDELLRQMKVLVPQIGKGNHAAARQVAGVLRISRAHAELTVDAQFTVSLRRAVDRYGKSGFLLNHGPTHERLARELAEYGLSHDQLPTATTYATKEQVLDALLASGLSAYLAKVADIMDVFANEMERRGPLSPVALRQNEAKCKELWGYIEAAEAAMASACATAAIFPNPVTAAACSFAVGALSGLLTTYWANCWLFR